MKGIARGEAKCFETLHERHRRAVYGLARTLMGSDVLGEELAQETWIRVVRASGEYEGSGACRSWILTICRRLCLNQIRAGDPEVALTEEMEQILPADEFSIEQEWLLEEQRQKLRAALEELPERQRVALTLWLTEEASLSDLAVELGLQVNAVKALLFRARESLRQKLEAS